MMYPAHRAVTWLALAGLGMAVGCTGRVAGGSNSPGGAGVGTGGSSASATAGRGGGSTGGSAGATAGTPGTGGTGAPMPPSGAPVACQPGEPGPTPLQRLTTRQYRNTVRDLLAASGVGTVADEVRDLLAAIPEDSAGRFRGLDNRVSAEHVTGTFKVAGAVADAITGRPERLAAVAGACAASQPLPTRCLDEFL
jgi:hypothetical protein